MVIMSRALRIQEEGAIYHVISRGNLKQDILAEDKDKAYLLKLLRLGAERYDIHIFAYCLMSNHYHLLLRITKKNLSEFMHYLGSSYANYLVRGGWVGHVFSGRYKAIRIGEEDYFLIVNRYICLNPVEAGIVERPEEYPWSSYGDLVNGGRAGWLERDWLTEYFGQSLAAARKEYRQFVEEGLGKAACFPENEIVAQALLGSEEFVKRIKKSIQLEKWTKEVIGGRMLSRTATLEEVYRAVCERLGFSSLEHGDFRGDEEYRYACWLMAYMAREYTSASHDEIGEVLGGLKGNAVSHRLGGLKRRLNADGEMQSRFDADVKRIVEILQT